MSIKPIIKSLRILSFGIVLILQQGCGWYDSISFPSPSGKARIAIGRDYLFSHLEVVLYANNRTRTVYKSPNDGFYSFVETCWSQDEKVVAVLITGTDSWPLAFDVRSGRELSFGQVRSQMESKIRMDYRVPSNAGDVINWAYSGDAQDQFSVKYPGAFHGAAQGK